MVVNLAPEVLGLDACDAVPDRWLSVEILTGQTPLSGETAPQDLRAVTRRFRTLLFDRPADGPDRQTYAILDAAVCPHLPELLETSDLPHRCLFTGTALQETGEVAPWLVALEPDHRLTRMLISTSDRPGGLWDLEPGIILRSGLDLAALWSHCRKFTRIQDAEGKWLFYRFWSAPVSTRVLSLGNRPELIPFVGPFFPADDPGFEVLLLNSDLTARLTRLPGTQPPQQRPVLTDAVQRTIRQVRRAQQYEELIDITLRHVQGKTALPEAHIRHNLRIKRDWYFDVGFWQRDHIAKLLVWEVLLGPEFIDTYAQGTIRAIIASARQPYEAIMNIEFFLEAQEIRRTEEAARLGAMP
ncbi:MAG: DUF4123 domain-containing protein [Alphaproteobacteria bacterium]